MTTQNSALRTSLNAVIDEVASIYHERETEARMITTGILAQQHSLLLGPPGTGKSAIVRELTGRIDSGVYWEILLHKFIAPSAIFGPIDLAALTSRNEHRQILEGHATRAHVAFLDEIFKCSAAALNSMLAYLNERLYHPESGGTPEHCPLISAVCASNELAEDETTAALYDRLLIRMEVDYLTKDTSFDLLLRSAVRTSAQDDAAPTRTTVDLVELQQVITNEVPAVELPGTVITALRDLRSDLRKREITSSDRRWKQSVSVLQSAAWLAGNPEVCVDDLATLTHVLWDVPANRSTVSRAIRAYLSPDDRDLADLTDEVDRIGAELDKFIEDQDDDKLREWAVKKNVRLAEVAKRLFAIRDAAQESGRAAAPYQRAVERVEHVHTTLVSKALGVAPDKVPALRGGRR